MRDFVTTGLPQAINLAASLAAQFREAVGVGGELLAKIGPLRIDFQAIANAIKSFDLRGFAQNVAATLESIANTVLAAIEQVLPAITTAITSVLQFVAGQLDAMLGDVFSFLPKEAQEALRKAGVVKTEKQQPSLGGIGAALSPEGGSLLNRLKLAFLGPAFQHEVVAQDVPQLQALMAQFAAGLQGRQFQLPRVNLQGLIPPALQVPAPPVILPPPGLPFPIPHAMFFANPSSMLMGGVLAASQRVQGPGLAQPLQQKTGYSRATATRKRKSWTAHSKSSSFKRRRLNPSTPASASLRGGAPVPGRG